MIKEFVAIIVLSLYFTCNSKAVNNQSVACRFGLSSSTCDDSITKTCTNNNNDHQRIIAIGDIHGSYESFLRILFSANLTVDPSQCEWQSAVRPTLLVQMGDLTDRGLYSLECFKCLAHLQATASLYNSTVIRLVGNHDLWWLEGHFHSTEESADRIIEHVTALRRDILAGKVQGAYYHPLLLSSSHNSNNESSSSILFTHSGFRQDYIDYINKQQVLKSYITSATESSNPLPTLSPSSLPLEKFLAQHVNSVLVERLSKCMARQSAASTQQKKQQSSLLNFQCEFKESLFQAGPDRGGDDIGGPFWTDFSVLKSDAENREEEVVPKAIQSKQQSLGQVSVANMIQVVGHTPPAFDRYTGQLKNTHIRTTKNMQAVCVDGGMPFGTYSFLEIRTQFDNHFIAHEYLQQHGGGGGSSSVEGGEWVHRDLTATECIQ